MAGIIKFGVTFSLIVAVFSKKLHVKEDLETKDEETKSYMNLFNNEEIQFTNERYVRHMQRVVTESVLDHLIDELKVQYFSENYNSNSPIRRLIRNLSKEMKRNEHNKMVKERQRKKLAKQTKSKSNRKNKKRTTRKLPSGKRTTTMTPSRFSQLS